MIIINWKRVFTSMYYFLKLIFIGKKYDVVFVSSTAFNRGENGENSLFKPMVDYCKKNDLNYVVFEETYFKSYIDYGVSEKSISLDFIIIIRILLNKIYNLIYKKPTTADQKYLQDLKISKILKNLFFRKFNSKVYITLIWNNVTLWRHINPSACVVDYQHAYIYDGEAEYMLNGSPPKIKVDNDVTALVHGERYKRILIDSDRSGFYSDKNVITVGSNKILSSHKQPPVNNKKILFTLQITPDFPEKEVNDFYVEIVEKLINANVDFLIANNYEIIFKHHPRYSRYECPDITLQHDFISFDNKTPLSDLLNITSLHMTFHSTSSFDAAIIGIPTIFIDMHEPLSPNEMFLKQYEYPCKDLVIKDYKDLESILITLNKKEIFNDCCDSVYEWSKEFYHDFDELAFGAFISSKIIESKNTQQNPIE